MTHLGDSFGFAPTMRQESLDGCSVLVVRDGQLHEGWNYMEMQGLMQRLKENSTQAAEETQQATVA